MIINPEHAGTYDVIYCDPPWKYGSKAARGGKYGALDYSGMTIPELEALPVADMAAPDCALFMWVTSPFLMLAENVAKAWGFTYLRCDRVWAKTTVTGKPHGVVGPWGLTDVEFLLLFTRGKMHKQQAVKNQYTMAWDEQYPGRHSAKPDRFRQEIVERFPEAKRIELFARIASEGWDTWGNEAPDSAPVFMSAGFDPLLDDVDDICLEL